MKKVIGLLVLFVLLSVPVAGFADRSGQKVADAAITTKGGALAGIVVLSGTTAQITVDVYDNASAASGNKVMPSWVIPASSTSRNQSVGFSVDPPVCPYYNGLYVDVTSTGPVTYEVYYLPTR